MYIKILIFTFKFSTTEFYGSSKIPILPIWIGMVEDIPDDIDSKEI